MGGTWEIGSTNYRNDFGVMLGAYRRTYEKSS